MISSPAFGYWSNKIKQVRMPLYAGLTMMIIGNILYIALEFVFIPRRYLMFVGRFITGAGSGNVTLLRTYASTASTFKDRQKAIGNVTLLRTYASTASTFKDRQKAIAYVTCGQAVGTTCGPVLQLIFTPFGPTGFKLFNFIPINMYTAPGYLACAMNIVGGILLHFYFQEKYAGIIETNNNDKDSVKIPMYDIIAILVCYFTRFTQMFINTNLETIGTAFSMMMFGWNEPQTVLFTSIAQGGVGILTFVTYILYIVFKLDR
uniref:Uncharacterized protein n=1 Tax=Panagrolaimus sp. JU765 TaxID=591449 RepID=A0AC34RDX2_9BILA